MSEENSKKRKSRKGKKEVESSPVILDTADVSPLESGKTAEEKIEQDDAQVAAPSRPKLSDAGPDNEVLELETAASEMVLGYRETWLAAIRARAKSMGVGETASRRVWRGVFISWGGPSILK